jgi:hypothetical protein
MTDLHTTIRDNIKRLGYAHNSHVKLYGQSFQLVSDPIVEGEKVVFVDGMESKSRNVRRVRIPLPIVIIARQAIRA